VKQVSALGLGTHKVGEANGISLQGLGTSQIFFLPRRMAEEDLEASKDLGLDQYEVRSYLGWYRHSTLVLLAYAFLVGICVQEHVQDAGQEDCPPSSPLIALTPSEARHLLVRLIWPLPASVPLVCAWSHFRRRHQYWAGYYHRRRRQKVGSL
jgi:hypothetical protein